MPDVCTYKNVFPVDFQTFGKLLIDFKDKKDKSKIPYLGSEVRFKDPTKSKSKDTVSVPGPGNYPMIAEWPGNN